VAHFANRSWPSFTADACPANGFFFCFALAGASWNAGVCAIDDEDNKNPAIANGNSELKTARMLSFTILLRHSFTRRARMLSQNFAGAPAVSVFDVVENPATQ
jgi:hypothetical protein